MVQNSNLQKDEFFSYVETQINLEDGFGKICICIVRILGMKVYETFI